MESTLSTPNQGHSSIGPMAIIGTLFFIFGFVTWLNGALIPFLQIVCQLNETQALFVAFAFYIAYTVTALPMAAILERTGYKRGMSLGLLVVAVGCLLFVPAAYSHQFWVFLAAQFIVGTGLTILQTASNPYIVHIGPKESAAARISVMGLLNKGAGVVAPIVFTALVLGDFDGVTAKAVAEMSEPERQAQIEALASGLVLPYIGMAVALMVLAVGLLKSNLPDLDIEEDPSVDTHGKGAKSSIMHFPQLVLGAIALFFYVGVEVIAGDTIGLFGSKLGVANATSLTSYTMAFMVIGYVLGLALIPRFIRQDQALTISAVLGLLLCCLVVFSSHESTAVSAVLWHWMGLPLLPDTVAFVALLGFANAMVWPAIWPLALSDLGKFTARGAALLIMGIAGGAILPLLYGVMSDVFSNQQAYLMMIPCYLFILHFALVGHKKRHWGRH
ncbi:sugar MFS transporter [Aestuariibacter halophilus]|uniref:Sugar MFS transporter n=1 Tax=Fluctibacter halophilus TaxID=226011 RepID=A0ABS8G9R3_9ALTE|nr:sugar MFS transporter [Aestuariibacter halophilus]MCC2617312.1 sugar MFS transporter [Aestuariibacter halophilus]